MKFDDAKILLFHPGKCAGTSVEISLVKHYMGKEHTELGPAKNPQFDILYGFDSRNKVYLQHCDLDYIFKHTDVDPNEYSSYTFVRNPYHRLVSAFYYNDIPKKMGITFEEFVMDPQGLLLRYDANQSHTINHFGLMKRFTHHPEYVVSNIGKVETLEQDFKRFFPHLTLPKHKAAKTVASSRHKNYMDLYSEEVRRRVYDLYKEDFITFGYNS